jgi:virulence factor
VRRHDGLRIGIVGAGNIAHVAQLPSLRQRDDVELVSVVTRRSDPNSLVRRWSFQHVYRSVDEMLDGAPLDAVFVLTPRNDHAGSVEACLKAGLDVFCEKPLAIRAADAHRLAELATARGQVLMVGFNRRFAPVYEAGREAFDGNGAAFCLAQKNRAGSEYRATFENAIHMVDLLRWYCGGEAVAVTAHALAPDPWEEEGLAALVHFDTGHVGMLMAARNAGGWDERLDAYGTGTSVKIEAPDQITITRSGVSQVRDLRLESFGWATATQTFGFKACTDHFIECVRERAEPSSSAIEAARTQDLLEWILGAAGLPVEENSDHEWSSHSTQ